jgi:hypothetical protein
MKSNIQIAGIVCSICLFAFPGYVQACADDGDQAIKTTPYYTPLINASNAYPVMNKSDSYDCPLISSGHGKFDTADLPENVT